MAVGREAGTGGPVRRSAVEANSASLLARSVFTADPESLCDPRLLSFRQTEGRGDWPGQISVH